MTPATAVAQVPLPPILPPGEPPSEPPGEPSPPPSGGDPEPGPPPRSTPYSGSAVNYRGGIARTAYTPRNVAVPPLEVLWGRRVGRGVGTPIIAQRTIFTLAVRVRGGGNPDVHRYRLEAFDARTGRLRWRRKNVHGGHMAYDAGRLFLAGNRRLTAYGAGSGRRLWQKFQHRDASNLFQAPVASGGRVFVVDGSSGVYAFAAVTGKRAWVRTLDGAGQSVPALWRGRLFTTNGCEAYAFDALTGKLAWRYAYGCSTGGSTVAAVQRGRVYPGPGSSHPPLDAETGAPRGRPYGAFDVLTSRVGVFAGFGVGATSLITNRRLWSAKVPEPYSGFDIGPAAAGSTVWVFDQNTDLRGYGLRHGDLREKIRLFDDHLFTAEGVGTIAIGEGVLAVPVTGRVIVFRSALRPPPRRIGVRVRHPDIRIGRRTRVDGRGGSRVRAKRVRLEVDPFPYGRFRPAGRRTTDRGDHTFRFRVRPDRNTRYRVRTLGGGKRRSRIVVAYVYPRVGLRARASGSGLVVRAKVRGAKGVRLGGRRLVIYVFRARRGRYERLGSGTLRRAGRTRAVATMGLRRVRFGPRDGIAFCIPGLNAMGRRDRLQRRCGAARARS